MYKLKLCGFKVYELCNFLNYFTLIFSGHRNTIINILIGIFTGFIISAVSSQIALIIERRRLDLKKSLYALEIYNLVSAFEKLSCFMKKNDELSCIKSFTEIAYTSQKALTDLISNDFEAYYNRKLDRVYCGISGICDTFMDSTEEFVNIRIELNKANISDEEYRKKFIEIIDGTIEKYSESMKMLNCVIGEKL